MVVGVTKVLLIFFLCLKGFVYISYIHKTYIFVFLSYLVYALKINRPGVAGAVL